MPCQGQALDADTTLQWKELPVSGPTDIAPFPAKRPVLAVDDMTVQRGYNVRIEPPETVVRDGMSREPDRSGMKRGEP